ncbi:glycosyltransferase [Paenibacillus flagellatus]|uniref:Glycosyl transferase family 2 n=1 Tax=Paenibacillus flagellatus TaxID=2211139 RepID=A0A2V5K9U5_9BACL|nr:glycosyltransferase [Paenibacillus flagellatus]PYI55662.1 glycosyl transferase family 2 [Paenibacillus flagellatus]
MTVRPTISIVIPARNEAGRIADTIRCISDTRVTKCELEFVVVDDASDDDGCTGLPDASLSRAAVRVLRMPERAGVARARNAGVRAAGAEIVFITDAHVRFEPGWDEVVLRLVDDCRVLAATVCDTVSTFRGYGCSLLVPFMGTTWNRSPIEADPPFVQIASSAGTVLARSLFDRIGGYDSGMKVYGGAEPEFGVRAWLSGAEIVSVPELRVWHRFKTKPEVHRFIADLKPYMLHNSLRFGLLYLGELGSLQMIRYFAKLYPEFIHQALQEVGAGDYRERRSELAATLRYDFAWLVRKFGIKDQTGADLLGLEPPEPVGEGRFE